MGNALTQESDDIVIVEESVLKDYKSATVADYHTAKNNFDTLQETMGDKMTVTEEEFDEIFSLICQDPFEHFALFDCWQLGKVDVLEVFAVVIVYCHAPIEDKVPLLFNLFDFDHSQEISLSELVLLMLCATRGLCKVVGLDRPDTEQLELLAQTAFTVIDRDSDGQVSLEEFTRWALHEPSLVHYLKRFASTRLIFEDQLQYDTLMLQLCESFVQHSTATIATNKKIADENDGGDIVKDEEIGGRGPPVRGSREPTQSLVCPAIKCHAIIRQHIPRSRESEVAYLISAMLASSRCHAPERSQLVSLDPSHQVHPQDPAKGSKLGGGGEPDRVVSIETFCTILSSYVAFIVADADEEHHVDLEELRILLWLMRGKEPTPRLVQSFMNSLDRDGNGTLNALEWVSYAIESDAATGDFSFATQVQLLFTLADTNGDAVLSIQELIEGLQPILLANLLALMARNGESASLVLPLQTTSLEKRVDEVGVAGDGADEDDDRLQHQRPVVDEQLMELRQRRQSQHTTVQSLITGLANELMQTMDKNQSHRIEWYEFRQHLDFLQQRIQETNAYIQKFVLQ